MQRKEAHRYAKNLIRPRIGDIGTHQDRMGRFGDEGGAISNLRSIIT